VINRAYVVDVAVRDLDAAAATFSDLLGIEGVRMDPAMDPSGELDGVHFAVGGINALGLMSYKGEPDPKSRNYVSRFLARHGDGIYLVGFLVDDLEAHTAELASRGVELMLPKPAPYAAGWLNLLAPGAANGVMIEFAQHSGPEESALWKTRYDNAPNRRVKQAYVVDVAVSDLASATATYANLFGMDGIPMATGMDASASTTGTHFPVGGLYAYGLMAPGSTRNGDSAKRFGGYLDQHGGDGAALLGFLVDDIDRTQSELEARGVKFAYEKPLSYAVGRLNITEPIHGVMLEFAQHDEDAYARWRAGS
jgi:catechol 2,3-dioxygenase-like lactoylglutathione lyase family enzyme